LLKIPWLQGAATLTPPFKHRSFLSAGGPALSGEVALTGAASSPVPGLAKGAGFGTVFAFSSPKISVD